VVRGTQLSTNISPLIILLVVNITGTSVGQTDDACLLLVLENFENCMPIFVVLGEKKVSVLSSSTAVLAHIITSAARGDGYFLQRGQEGKYHEWQFLQHEH